MVNKTGRLPKAGEADSILEYLSAMLASWGTKRLLVYATRDESLPVVAGTSTYTIGPSGDLNTTRPVKIEAAYWRVDDINYPLKSRTSKEWPEISDATTTSSIPEDFNYEGTMPTGTLRIWPEPSESGALYLTTWTPISSLALSDTLALPPGYEDAIVFNLALRIEQEFGDGRGLSPLTVQTARETLAAIQLANSNPLPQKGASNGLTGVRNSQTLKGLFP